MLLLPANLPAAAQLRAEGYDVKEYAKGEVRPEAGERTLFLLNLMPEKEETERDICRQFAASGETLRIVLLKFPNQPYKHTPVEHMDAFYVDVEDAFAPFLHTSPDAADAPFVMITGAPLENVPYEDVRYWEPCCRFMAWAEQHARRTFLLCWAAFAELYRLYGVPMRHLSEKRFGIYLQHPAAARQDLPAFPCPVSRHIEVQRDMIEGLADLTLLYENEESGVGVLTSHEGRKIFMFGHLEYPADRLEREYRRDVSLGKPIAVPKNYYQGDDPAAPIKYTWEEAARSFYRHFVQ